jgi:hypothetical protein
MIYISYDIYFPAHAVASVIVYLAIRFCRRNKCHLPCITSTQTTHGQLYETMIRRLNLLVGKGFQGTTLSGIFYRDFLETKSSTNGYVTFRSLSSTSSSNQSSTEPISIKHEINTHKIVTPVAFKEYIQAFSDLSKAKLSALVVSTSSFGFLAATSSSAIISFPTLAALSIGTALCSSSASALNQIFERDRDALMKRTAQRPLVTKSHVNTSHAWNMAIVTGFSGAMTLYLGTDPITAGAITFHFSRSNVSIFLTIIN